MAYVDQDFRREKTVSGVAAIAIVGAVGYVFVSGMAVNMLRQVAPPFVVHNWASDVPPPPPMKASPPPKTSTPTQRSTTVDQSGPVVETSVSTIDLGPPVQQQILGPVSVLPPPPPMPDPTPQTVDRSVSAKPRGDPGDWVGEGDYPAAAIRDGREGSTRFRVDISAEGRPTGCTVVAPSGSPDLDDAACRAVMRHARFSPAVDASGGRIASSYTSTVVWRLPGQ